MGGSNRRPSVRARLQLLVNSQTHLPVAVYCGGKPCERRPKNTNSTAGSFTFSTATRTHVCTYVWAPSHPPPTPRHPPSLFLRAALRPTAILQGSGWTSGGEQLQIGISCARLAESRGRKKKKKKRSQSSGGFPRRNEGREGKQQLGPNTTNKRGFPQLSQAACSTV